jgi:hypothetical protein
MRIAAHTNPMDLRGLQQEKTLTRTTHDKRITTPNTYPNNLPRKRLVPFWNIALNKEGLSKKNGKMRITTMLPIMK